MYNQIWSPLKQEFVETLSLDGRQALKMYVNSFMTGGADPAAAVTAAGDGVRDAEVYNEAAKAVEKLTKDNTLNRGDDLGDAIVKLEKVNNVLMGEFNQQTKNNTKVIDTLGAEITQIENNATNKRLNKALNNTNKTN
jgi:hypothetical protein